MPGGNKTGPFGQGPKTGRGLDFCSGSHQPGFRNSNENFWYGQGLKNSLGRSNLHCFRHGFGSFSFEEPTNASLMTLLEDEARILKEQLSSVEKQLAELKKKTD